MIDYLTGAVVDATVKYSVGVKMRIIIYGAGAIGGTVGGFLVKANQDVVFIEVSPSHVKAIREQGLKLVTPAGTNVLRVSLVTAPDQISFGPDDVVFLCVKGQYTEGVLRDLKAVTKDVPIFCFQNGVQNEGVVAKYFSRVYGVSIRGDVVYVNPGEVIDPSDPPGFLAMGQYPTGTDDLVETVAKSMRTAGYFVLVTPDVMLFKWGKLLANLGNAIGAITSERGGDSARIAQAARQEAEEVMTQSGIRWIAEEQMGKEWQEFTSRRRIPISTEAKGSSWQSLARQEGTIETDFFQGEIVRAAKLLGRQAPINETLLRISQEMAVNREPPGKYPAEKLLGMLGLS